MQTETEIFAGIIVFLAIIGFISLYLPTNMKILSLFDFYFLGGSIAGLGAACVVLTGIPCAAAIGVFTFANFLGYFILPNPTSFPFLKILIIMPITLIITYLMVRMAKGGG